MPRKGKVESGRRKQARICLLEWLDDCGCRTKGQEEVERASLGMIWQESRHTGERKRKKRVG